jgi:hypothetical protein
MQETVRFYNAGDKFSTNFYYTKPDTNFKEDNGGAYWPVVAEKQSFFEVPFELQTSDGGTYRITVHKEITSRYGKRGVIRIDANLKTIPDTPEYQFAANSDEMAKEKGATLWKSYLRNVVEEFEAENQRRVTERGLAPRRPTDFVAHAYKELGLAVPGDEAFIKAGIQKSEVDQLREQVAEQAKQVKKQTELIEQLLAAKPDTATPPAAGKKSQPNQSA